MPWKSDQNCSGRFREGAGGAPPPLGTQILSISCSFRENLAKSYVGAPPPGELVPPPGEILDPPLNCTQKSPKGLGGWEDLVF